MGRVSVEKSGLPGSNLTGNQQHGLHVISMKGESDYSQLSPFITLMHSFGAKWSDMNWQPQLTSPAFEKAFKFYIALLKDCGEPGAPQAYLDPQWLPHFPKALDVIAADRGVGTVLFQLGPMSSGDVEMSEADSAE